MKNCSPALFCIICASTADSSYVAIIWSSFSLFWRYFVLVKFCLREANNLKSILWNSTAQSFLYSAINIQLCKNSTLFSWKIWQILLMQHIQYVIFWGFSSLFKEIYKKNDLLFFFFLIGIHSMQGWTATKRHGVTRKRSTKRLEHTGNMFRKDLQLKDVC